MPSGVIRVEIRTDRADEAQMRKAVFEQTGDEVPFFCPRVVVGEAYDGHAHAFPPAGVSEPDLTPIVLRNRS